LSAWCDPCDGPRIKIVRLLREDVCGNQLIFRIANRRVDRAGREICRGDFERLERLFDQPRDFVLVAHHRSQQVNVSRHSDGREGTVHIQTIHGRRELIVRRAHVKLFRIVCLTTAG